MSNHDIPCRGCGEDQRLLGLSHEANCLASKLGVAESLRDEAMSSLNAAVEAAVENWKAKAIEAERGRIAAVSRLEVVSKEVEAMEALLEKATNDVSAWNSRASGAESRLQGAEKLLVAALGALEGTGAPVTKGRIGHFLANVVERQSTK